MTKEYKNWLFLEVEEDANHFRLNENMLQWFAKENGRELPQLRMLPSSSWLIVGMSGQLDKECYDIIDTLDDNHKDYKDGRYDSDITHTESLASLIESIGMKNNCLILKKK